MGCKISVDIRETLKGSPKKNSAIVKKEMKSIHTSPMVKRKLSTKLSSVSPDKEDDKIDEARSSHSASPEVVCIEISKGIKYVKHIRKDKCERRLCQNTDSRDSEWQLHTN